MGRARHQEQDLAAALAKHNRPRSSMPAHGLPGAMLALQRTAGNRAVAQLVAVQRGGKPGQVTAPAEEHESDVDAELGQGAVKFTLTLAAWQADPNFLRKSARYTIVRMLTGKKVKMTAPRSTGHSWVELRGFDRHSKVVAESTWGFGPGGFMHPDSFAGQTGDDTLYKDYPVDRPTAESVLGKAMAIRKANPKYEVLGYNCTAFARDLIMAAGLKFPGRKVNPLGMTKGGKAFTPNRLYGALKSQKKKGGSYSLNANRGLPPVLSEHDVPADRMLTLYDAPLGGHSAGVTRGGGTVGLTGKTEFNRVQIIYGGAGYWVAKDEIEDLIGGAAPTREDDEESAGMINI